MIEDSLALRITELGGLLLSDETLETTLQRVADLALQVIEGCDACSVTMQAGTGFLTAASTDSTARTVDEDQYRVDDGPCLDAIRHQRTNRVDEVTAESRWPDFCRLAEEHGISSFLAVPLEVRGEAIGALNLYSRLPRGFDKVDEDVVDLFAGQAGAALANAQVYRSAHALTAQLQEAMASRAVIEQAKGALMSQHRCSADKAFERLTAMSQRSNRKLRYVAQSILDELDSD